MSSTLALANPWINLNALSKNLNSSFALFDDGFNGLRRRFLAMSQFEQ